MRILVTGGTGFIGRHMLPMLAGHDVYALTRGRPIDRAGLDHVSWITADLSDGLDTSSLPARMDAIIHLAQSDRYREFPAGAPDVLQVNVRVPAQLLDWAKRAGVSRAVFASTGTVYEPFAGAMAETQQCAPTGYYGSSKLACETLSWPYQSVDLAVAQMRIFFAYGPSQSGAMIARLIDNVRAGTQVSLPQSGDGLVFVPTYVTDTARVMVQACVERWQGAWNLASPHAVSMKSLFEQISTVVGRAPVIVRTDQMPPSPIVPDLTKLRTKIDVATFVTPAEGLRRTIAAARPA